MKAIIAALLLAACTDSEYERQIARAAVNERIREHCVPVGNERVLIAWKNGELVCQKHEPSKSYRPTKVTNQAVATMEDML